MKKVVAIKPYQHPDSINFKNGVYEAWKNAGGLAEEGHYPPRLFHAFAFTKELPTIYKNKKQARLRFVEPISIKFDTFPDYCRYEIIPFIWDCWPVLFDKTCEFLKKHNVRTAFFTSSQAAEAIHERLPHLNAIHIPEGIDSSLYKKGSALADRKIDILEFGRNSGLNIKLPENVNHVYRKGKELLFKTNDELFETLSDTKITIALPRCDTDPAIAGGIETLTQRYWECMLSGIIPLGRAPKELTDLIGYNPVVDINRNDVNNQIMTILNNIESYQPLIEKNFVSACRYADWSHRITLVKSRLIELGYDV